MAKQRRRAVGILIGGGDCPGLNAVIRAATRAAMQFGWEMHGIEDGFDGLLRNKVRRLTANDVRGILALGGTILGSTNRMDPFLYPTRVGRARTPTDRSADVVRSFHSLGLAGLIAVGGDGTLALAERFHRKGIPIVGIPKTIDNDIPGTVASFGFDTAVGTATDALDKLHPTAEAHKRVIVIEVMGRNTGWVALHAGIAGGADVVLIPEIPFRLDSVVESVRARERQGREFSLVVVAEGAAAIVDDSKAHASKEVARSSRHDGIAARLAEDIGARLKKEAHSLALGHLQRGGSPSTFDRLLATRFGTAAMRLVDEGLFGNMVALKPPTVVAVPLHQVVGKVRQVPLDSDVIRSARDLGIGFGE
jgi:ATP-dependent phosphofructokinase / diphosphate-dependent phosphofructokinase